jgi:hypothetical protein
MTVKELIEKLKDVPDNYDVTHLTYGTDSHLNPTSKLSSVQSVLYDYTKHSITLR